MGLPHGFWVATGVTVRGPVAVFIYFLTGAAGAAAQQTPAPPRLVNVFLARDDVMPSASWRALPDLSATEAITADREVIDVEVVVDQTGALRHARIARPNPVRAARERAALDAVGQWRFRAATTSDGRPRTALAVARFTIERPTRAGEAPRVQAAIVTPSRELPDPAPMPAEIYQTIGRGRPPGLRDPVTIRGIIPSYDDRAIRAKTQGEVMLEIVILPDGTVGDARVTRSLDDALDREALIAARHWLFQPATLDGQPVACRSVLLLTFRLN